MLDFLIFLSIIFPALAGGVAFMHGGIDRKRLVVVTSIVLVISALGLALYSPARVAVGSGLATALRWPIFFLDLALLCLILYIGWLRKHRRILYLASIQLVGLIILEFFMHPQQAGSVAPAFVIDSLSVTLVLVITIVGSCIAYYAIGYMKAHEEHLHLKESRQPRFFALILLFLGAMNGLVLSDDLSWLILFWEITTICSFLLIGHDRTEEADRNALRALWVGTAGGVAFIFALLYLQQAAGTLSLATLQEKVRITGEIRPDLILVPMVALCFAAFTKSAQLPFQKWLTGAMVAPTPVSALLHSSTMVKAGVHLVLRLSPLYQGAFVSSLLALCGAFTFIAAAALATGQSNSKKILAYSTISNLGLIIACAGINTAASLAAGMLLLVFHAISKALLFLCVGAIEQKIGSRNIEDMRGLFKTKPRTALITTFGIITMMLPPFGMLLAKWMTLESAVEATLAMPLLVDMLALGSGLTVLFWARWAGILLGSANPELKVPFEYQDSTISRSLVSLTWGAAILSFFSPLLYAWLVKPAVQAMVIGSSPLLYESQSGGIGNSYGLFAVYPIFILIGLGFWYAWRATTRSGVAGKVLPYMGGMQATQGDKTGFTGPMKGFVEATSSNYYLESFFGEDRITKNLNLVAIALLFILLGGVMQ